MASALTAVRYRVVAMTMLMAGITYLDRVCISVLAPSIMRDLNITTVQMSYVFSAFTFAYALFEVPTAWWADRIGTRKVLTRIVLWWSSFTILTGAVTSYAVMLAVRALFGLGEAGAWPNASRVFSRWIPVRERARVQGVFFASAHLAGGFTPAIIAWIATFLSWRAAFASVGVLGFLWALAWYAWYRDEPREHSSVTAAEVAYIEAGRDTGRTSHAGWRAVMATPGLLPLCLQYFANTYGLYFFITWLPTYLSKAHGLQSAELALFSGLPLILSAVADVLGGAATDALALRFGSQRGSQIAGVAGYTLASFTMLLGTFMSTGSTAGLCIAIAGAFSMFTLAAAWSTAIRLGGPDAAVVSAIMNSVGQAGGILSPIVLAYVVDWTGNWNLPLRILAALYLVSALAWHWMRRLPADTV